MFDPDDLSLLATLGENPSLAQSEEFSSLLKRLKPQSQRLAKAIVLESADAPAASRSRARNRRKTAGGKAAGRKAAGPAAKRRAKSAAKRARKRSIAHKQARSILTWAKENRSRKK